ncbi:MAG: SRPBCC family protein, partial [Thermoanaerobaculia bacterium]
MQRGNRNTIYVETLIRAPLEDVWTHTQNPSLHERWDLRFTTIEYTTRDEATARQQFRYATRMGFGVEISGTGESIATTEQGDGARVSSLTFRSEDPISLILKGSGYWKYIPTADGVRFITAYDYEQRFGSFGRMVDSITFRPLMGWATAWSFDRLRLWLERSIDPAVTLRNA